MIYTLKEVCIPIFGQPKKGTLREYSNSECKEQPVALD